MNERIEELMDQCEEPYSTQNYPCWDMEKFAELIIRECVNTLEFHGFDDAVPYIKYMATNKFGVEE